MVPEVSLRAQFVAVLLSSLWLAGIIYLVMRESLSLRSSLGWVTIGLVAVGISVYPKSLFWFARAIGIGLPSNALFLFGFLAVLILLFGHTLAITRLLGNVRSLSQRVALHELEGHADSGGADDEPTGGRSKDATPDAGTGEHVAGQEDGPRDASAGNGGIDESR